MVIKTEKLSFRIHAADKAKIRDAAIAQGLSISEFVLDASISHAQEVILDRREFNCTPDQYDGFLAALKQPGAVERMKNLLAIPVPWQDNES